MKRILALAALTLLPILGRAETLLGTAIPSVPYTITKPGAYHFTKDLAVSSTVGNAITINTSSVVIDLNGHQLACSSGSGNATVGIYCSGYSRVTVRNGVVRTFQNGIVLNANIASVTDVIASNNYVSGITLAGYNNQALRNRVVNTGGSGTSAVAIGISLSGTYGTVTDNDVQNTTEVDATSRSSYGIRLKNCSNLVVNNNRVLDVEPSAPLKSKSCGIATEGCDTLVVLGNTVATAQTGFDLSGSASGKFGDNTTAAVSSAYVVTGTTMVDIGNNN